MNRDVNYRVYWTVDKTAYAKDFGKDEMNLALLFCQALRVDTQKHFITMVSEIPECTSLSGVAAPSADYDWKKRRK